MYLLNTHQDENGHPYLVKEKELAKSNEQYRSPAKIAEMLRELLHAHEQTEEHLYMLCFDTKLHLKGIFEISHGLIDQSICSPREVFMKALLCNAKSIVLAHNHPSNDATPSKADYEVADQMKKSGDLLGVALLDSIVVTKDDYFSANERGLFREGEKHI